MTRSRFLVLALVLALLSTSPAPFTIKVTTFEDVQVEIEGVGIFPGKILRTTK